MSFYKSYPILLLLGLFLSFSACSELLIEPDPADNPVENFELLWREVNAKYTFFEYKNIDWQAVYQKYRPQVNEKTTDEALFNVLNSTPNNDFAISKSPSRREVFFSMTDVWSSFSIYRQHKIKDMLSV